MTQTAVQGSCVTVQVEALNSFSCTRPGNRVRVFYHFTKPKSIQKTFRTLPAPLSQAVVISHLAFQILCNYLLIAMHQRLPVPRKPKGSLS